MSTDFFQQQDTARRKTTMLVVLFLLAVAAIVLTLYLLVAVIFLAQQAHPSRGPAAGSGLAAFWDPAIFLGVALGTGLVIGLGSLYKTAQLASGGESVALMLGGRLVEPRTTELAEKRLLNVVEEMALASGIPVPPVYVLDDEAGINAFAAGHSPQNAVIGVSRGAMTYLNRDELQGVMGHEFSHILNGDMRLNLRLIGILHGILILAILGYYMMRIAGNSSGSSRKKGGAAAIVLLGLGMMIIGYIGVFFGKLIKAAVSRQREFLADASAVQFTRDPGGIAGALKKIGGLAGGSRVKDAHAEEVSHLFFGDALAGSFFNFFATHPPLAERIRRIEPDFDGTFPPVKPTRAAEAAGLAEEEVESFRRRATDRRGAAPGGPRLPQARDVLLDPTGVSGRIGLPGMGQILFAAAILDAMPRPVLDAAHEPYGARAILYAMLLNRDEDMRRKQLADLQPRAEDLCYRETLRLATQIDQLAEDARLPLVDVALPALKKLTGDQYAAFRDNVEALVAADGKMDLFEYAVRTVLLQALDVHFRRAKPPAIRYHAVTPLLSPMTAVLSTLAYAGQETPEEAQRALDQAAGAIGKPMAILAREECGLRAFDDALKLLAQASPQVKKKIVSAAAACVGADGKVTVKEGELFRVVAAMLGCPMPPLVPSAAAGENAAPAVIP